jgi:orotidine-5'-phosphate decarboxylase
MNEIIVSLDGCHEQTALKLADKLQGKVWGFKVNDLILQYGTPIITKLKQYGNVFADPKLHDTPMTVSNSVKRLSWAGADFITVHLSGGPVMLKAAKEAAGRANIIGVSVLTSLSKSEILEIHRGYPVRRMCCWAMQNKLYGIVCSGHEMPYWSMFKNLKKIVPGIRPTPVKNDDQSRTVDIITADYLVLGRPITLAKDPVEAVELLRSRLDSIQSK